MVGVRVAKPEMEIKTYAFRPMRLATNQQHAHACSNFASSSQAQKTAQKPGVASPGLNITASERSVISGKTLRSILCHRSASVSTRSYRFFLWCDSIHKLTATTRDRVHSPCQARPHQPLPNRRRSASMTLLIPDVRRISSSPNSNCSGIQSSRCVAKERRTTRWCSTSPMTK